MEKKYFLLVLILFGPLSRVNAQEYDITAIPLETAVEVGIANNLTLKRSQLDLMGNEAVLLEARGQRFPSLSASASGRFNWGRSINPVTNLFETRRIGNINISANSNVTLFAGRQITHSIRQAGVEVEVGRLNVAATKNEITLNIINLFVNVVFAKEQVKIAESQLKTLNEQLQRTSKLVEAGALPLSEKLDMEAQEATGELEVINAANNLRLAKLNLAQQLLIPFSEDLDVSVPDLKAEDYPLPNVDEKEIFSLALENMPQIKAAQLAVTSAELGVKIAKGSFYPSLGLGGNLFSNYIDQPSFGDAEGFNTQISNNLSQALGLNLNIPVFSNFRNKANLQRARVQRNLSEVQELEVKNQLRQDIETSYTNAYSTRQAYYSSLSRVASLEEAFRMAQQRFEVGAINSVDFQVAQNNLFNAQADLLNAKYEYIFSVKVLDFYLGNPISL